MRKISKLFSHTYFWDLIQLKDSCFHPQAVFQARWLSFYIHKVDEIKQNKNHLNWLVINKREIERPLFPRGFMN